MNEASFVAALLDPALPTPTGLVRPNGQPAHKRFAVYRNNVAASLTEVLQVAFPAIRKLVGSDFFAAMSGAFLRQHPPRNRTMMLYGGAFADFLATFPPVASYPYLADVARLEQALRESYHAADAEPMAAGLLASVPEATLLLSRPVFAPALRLIRSPWPIHAIWRANIEGGPAPVAMAQDVLILRPDYDPRPHLLPQGGGLFMTQLLTGSTVAEALSAVSPTFDLTVILTLFLNGRAITGLSS
jgi:hypothetical protein